MPVVGDAKKYYVQVHISIDWTHKTLVHDITNSWFCSLHRDNNSINFKNMHFEICFQKSAFSGPQNTVVSSVFSWKRV